MTTFDEFMNKVRLVIPTAQVEEDNYGQLIIYTGLSRANGNIIYFEPDPTCDICGEPMECERGEDCTVHAGDWNGETGNHRSCEERESE